MAHEKESLVSELISSVRISDEITKLMFSWKGPTPLAGQFFMVKPLVSNTFLARPISVAWTSKTTVQFLVALKGKGTKELIGMSAGSNAELTGPLGNCWNDFLSNLKNISCEKIALVSGGVGVAPLVAFATELKNKQNNNFDFFAGFKTKNDMTQFNILSMITEDGSSGGKGLVTDYVDTSEYGAIFSCGPFGMMRALYNKCKKTNTSLFISMEQRMACGVGACLGCTIKTHNGNKRCCADGPIFNASEIFDD